MTLLRDLWASAPRRLLVAVVVIVAGAAGQALAAALAGRVLVDRSLPSFTALVVALVVAVTADLTAGLNASALVAQWSADVRVRLCRSAFGQPLPTLEATPVGELLDRIDGDVHQVATEVRGPGLRVVQATTTGALSVVTAFVVWWPAGLTMTAVVGVLAVLLAGPVRTVGPARMREEEAWSDVAAVVEEAVYGQDDVRTSLARPYVLKLHARRAAVVLERGRRVWRLGARVTLTAGVVTHLGAALVAVGGAWSLATGRADGARVTAVWLLALGFGVTAAQVSRQMPHLQYALGAWGRVVQLRAAPQEPAGGQAPVDGDVELRGLTFRYPDGRTALRDIDLTFRRGRSYALVGRSGSGKTTLTKVLTRAVEVPRGTVFVGGVDVVDLDVEELRRWVAVVPQRTEILAGTLAENVALFDETLLDDAGKAMRELGLSSWVQELPDGLRTRLGDGGFVLSAGQEQLVAFARILVRNPRVVVLDEATARLDPVTEAQVQRATGRLLTGRIGLLVAHRLSSVQRCDEVVVLADGEVVEAAPTASSRRFARLLASASGAVAAGEAAAVAVLDREPAVDDGAPGEVGPRGSAGVRVTVAERGDPPPAPQPPPARTLREIARLVTNDPRYGLASVGLFLIVGVLGLNGAALPQLWAQVVDGVGAVTLPVAAIVACLVVSAPVPWFVDRWFPEWWVRQMLRTGLRLVHGQTGPRRVSAHTPAEVVAQSNDTERVVVLADNLVDQFITVFLAAAMTVVAGTWVPAGFFLGAVVLSGLAATGFGPLLARSARRTVAARAAFSTVLASTLAAARTVKLAGATGPVLARLAVLDAVRSRRQRHEVSTQVWARSTPAVVSGLLPVGAWALYLRGDLSAGATLVTVSSLGAARWFAWTTASLVSQLPSARVWTRRTVAMCGAAAYSATVPGVDLAAGTAPGPVAMPRHRLERLDLVRFGAIHTDGTVGVRDVDLTVRRGELVLLVGPVGSGKSSLLRALAGIVHHTGTLCWNGQPVTEPEAFLRPQQVGYVGQVPRVLSGTIADNIRLGHEVDAEDAVTAAQLDRDLGRSGEGLGLVIGHKGTRLSGGQLQRLALARALAPGTELLVADDVSSALDVTTELELWQALRERRVTVIGATAKRAALAHADVVVVLVGGRVVAHGPWPGLVGEWGHLAG